jgi:hypothetical protein
LVKLKKSNFGYSVVESDDVKIEGDIQVGWVQRKNQIL